MLGVPTGAAQLDSLLGCFTAGVDLLAGPPGMGKTTLACRSGYRHWGVHARQPSCVC